MNDINTGLHSNGSHSVDNEADYSQDDLDDNEEYKEE